MNTPDKKEKNESVKDQDEGVTKVNTVDYRTSAGQCQEQRDVQVIHQSHSTTASGGSILASAAAGAAAAASTTLQSAKNAMLGKQ